MLPRTRKISEIHKCTPLPTDRELKTWAQDLCPPPLSSVLQTPWYHGSTVTVLTTVAQQLTENVIVMKTITQAMP